jgi:hypothetical protein
MGCLDTGLERDWKGTGLVCDALTPGLAGLSLINQQILWTIVF